MSRIDHKRRFESLDALRAVACFLVIWQHVSGSLRHLSSGGDWAYSVANYFDLGRVGVVAFFCISGFVIPSSLRGPRASAARAFAINRFFRLYPLYWVSIVLAILVYVVFSRHELTLAQTVANLGMVAVFFDQPHLMGLFWTLEVELVFYASSAALYLAFGNQRIWAALTGFSLGFLTWKSGILASYSGNLPILGFFMAIMFTASMARCAYDLKAGKMRLPHRYQRWLCYGALGLMTYILVRPLVTAIEKSFAYPGDGWNLWGWGHLLGIALFALCFLVGKTPAWLSWAGRWTYSAYLFHAIVFELLGRVWKPLGLPQTRLEVFIGLSALFTFGVAYLSFRYIEAPSIRLGKRLAHQSKNV